MCVQPLARHPCSQCSGCSSQGIKHPLHSHRYPTHMGTLTHTGTLLTQVPYSHRYTPYSHRYPLLSQAASILTLVSLFTQAPSILTWVPLLI